MLIIHALKTLNIDNLSFNQNKNLEYHLIRDNSLREKIFIYNTYYDFIENESCITILSKINNILNDFLDVKINKDQKLALSIIITKSFLEKFNISEKNNKFINSDDIFNYINDQFFKYLLTSKTFIPRNSIKSITIYALDLLIINKIIDIKLMKTLGIQYKTYKYYKINIQDYKKTIYHYFNFSFDNFKLLEFGDDFYITTYHYSKTYNINKQNFNSNKSFRIKNKNYIINKANIKLYVDEDFQIDLRKELDGRVSTILTEIENKTEEIEKFFEHENWTSLTKSKIANMQAEISKLTNKILLIAFAYFKFKNMFIIFPLYMDFRGRKYYYSPISPTNSKLIRLSYYYGYYDKTEFNNNNKYSIAFTNEILDFCNKNNINRDINYHETIFWCLIGIGKHFINKNNYPVDLKTFIEKGIEYFDKENKLKLEDRLEVKHYSRIIKSLYGIKIKKRIIIKDATASINQIFMKKLGPINQDSLNYVNLGNNHQWYDTYLVHRDKFYEYIIKHNKFESFREEKYKIYFSRKLIKNTIMIIPYSAGFDLCWQNYINNIKSENPNLEITKELKKIYNCFYMYIKDMIQDQHFYIKNTKTLINKMNEEFEELRKYVLESETGEADISYYKMKKSSVDKKYKINGESFRITKLILVPTTAIDITAFNTACGANTAHFLDADEIRDIEIELGYCIITIHDSYLIDFLNCTKLIDIKLKHYQIHIDKFESKYNINNIFNLL